MHVSFYAYARDNSLGVGEKLHRHQTVHTEATRNGQNKTSLRKTHLNNTPEQS